MFAYFEANNLQLMHISYNPHKDQITKASSFDCDTINGWIKLHFYQMIQMFEPNNEHIRDMSQIKCYH